MEQREIMEQVNKMLSDNPAKIIKISDREYERIRYIFRDIDVPLSWCTNKAAVYQLYKAVNQRRNRDSGSVYSPSKKSSRSKKKGLFGGFFN